MELVNLRLIATFYVLYIVGIIGGIEVTNEQQLDGSEVNHEHGDVRTSINTTMKSIYRRSKFHKYISKRQDYETGSIIPASCNSVIDVNEGDVIYMFSDSFSGTTKCDIKFKSPLGTTLNAFCPIVDLDKTGCSQENLFIKSTHENRVIACKNYGELNLDGTINYLKLKYRRKDTGTSTDVRGFFCMISLQSEFKAGIQDSIVSLNRDQVGYIVSDGNQDTTMYSLFFEGVARSTLRILCPMVELNADGCLEEMLILVDTGYESNSINACQVSCKTSLSTSSKDLEVIYRRIKRSSYVRGFYCIVVANTGTTTTISTSTTTSSTTTTSTTTTTSSTTTTSTTTTTSSTTTTSTTTTTTTTAMCTLVCENPMYLTIGEDNVILCRQSQTFLEAESMCECIGAGMYFTSTIAGHVLYLAFLEDLGLCGQAWAPFKAEGPGAGFTWPDGTDVTNYFTNDKIGYDDETMTCATWSSCTTIASFSRIACYTAVTATVCAA